MKDPTIIDSAVGKVQDQGRAGMRVAVIGAGASGICAARSTTTSSDRSPASR